MLQVVDLKQLASIVIDNSYLHFESVISKISGHLAGQE